MTIHISARVAWHDSGWNGCICRNPAANTYCVGQYSFPGDMIAEQRKLEWEKTQAGRSCARLDDIPPCAYSINAFGPAQMEARSHPPDWFNDNTEARTWELPAYSVGIWPYEEMYKDEVLNPQGTVPKYNPVRRRQAVSDFFAKIAPDRSLIFYYANYSNPFSEDDQHYYVIIGVSRIKAVGQELTWVNQSPEMEKRFGPNVWIRSITSHYPDQGLKLPYHAYVDVPEVSQRFLFVPDNPRGFKYATRHISDDGALGLIERLSEIVGVLQEIGDTSEDWPARQAWLASLMAELWQNRGLYPGILRVWDYLHFAEAIPYAMAQASGRSEHDVKDELFAFVGGTADPPAALRLDQGRVKAIRQQWRYLEPDQQTLLRDILPCFDLQTAQIKRVMDNREQASVYCSLAEITGNPYILSEQYVGNDPDDQISFAQIDHGMFPSPELGVQLRLEPNDPTRLRALCVEQLQKASQHTFLTAIRCSTE
jgi:exodeoxyribonuclease V alpha subunit